MKITKELVIELTKDVEALVVLRTGQRLHFVCLLAVPTPRKKNSDALGILTNHSQNEEVTYFLETALEALKEGQLRSDP